MDTRDLADAVDNALQVFEVGNFEDHVDVGLTVFAAGRDVADVGVGVADDGGDLFKHAEAIVAEQRDFYGIGDGLAIFVSGPEDIDAAIGLVEKVSHVRTIDGVDGDAFAPSYVAGDGFSANWITTAGAIDEEIAGSANDDGVGIASEDAADHARNST